MERLSNQVYYLDMPIARIHMNDKEEAICSLCGQTFTNDIKEIDGLMIEWYSLKKHFLTVHIRGKKD